MIIFEDGYLKSEFINPEYRGLVGWECEWYVNTAIVKANWHFELGDKLMAISKVGNFAIGENFPEAFRVQCIRIPQFTTKDIPIGELVWFKSDRGWLQRVLGQSILSFLHGGSNYDEEFHSEYVIVPYLIAKTKEDAERLKRWDR